MAEPKNIRLKLWGSSHLTRRHHLPQEVENLLSNLSRFHYPAFDARGGRIIDSGLVESIKNDMSLRDNSPQVHVIILGSNNIRDGWRPKRILTLFREVIEHCGKLRKCHLVICGILSSVRCDSEQRKRFQTTTAMLKQLSKEHLGHSSFLNIGKTFTVNGSFCQELFQDNIHLNVSGASKLAKVLVNHLQRLPKSHFE